MRLYFRPLPAFTVVSLFLFAVLMGLGVWQLERLQWKLALIQSVNQALAAPPISLERALAMGAGAQYHRVALTGRLDSAREAYVFVTGMSGEPGYHVLVPFHVEDGKVFLVDRGFVPPEKRDPARRPPAPQGEIRIVGVWRTPDAPGLFTPAPDLVHRIWYARDLASIARADAIRLAAPVLIEADNTPNPGGWPKGGQTQVTFRNEHLQYAITWFALGAALLLIYLAYHRSRGRLAFR